VVPSSLPPCGRRGLVLAILLALPVLGQAQSTAPDCPVGVLSCPPRPLDWGMCRKNDLLDFYIPGLPTEGERSEAPQDISAERISTPDADRYLLEGKAELRQLDLVLHADRFEYNHENTDFAVEGHVRYQDRSLLAAADSATGNVDQDQCTLAGVRYQLLGSRGNGIAEVAVIDDRQHAQLEGATYSTCDLASQQWAFAAREITLDREEGVGRARDVTLRVVGVPVLWLPYLRFPIDDRRQSGFLLPTVGYGERRGLDVTAPYYLNLAPNYDATLMPRVMSQRGAMLGAEFRYLTDAGRGQFSFDVLPHDRGAADEERQYGESLPSSRWWYQWQNSSGFGPNWSATANVNRVSDDRYFEDFGRGLYSSATSFLPSRIYLNGRGDGWAASFGGDDYQITDPTLGTRTTPYRRLPRATFEGERAVLGPLALGVDAEFVAFSRDDSLGGRRVDVFPYVSMPIETAAYFVRPQIGYRYTGYELDHLEDANNPLVTRRRPDRGVPIFSLDAGLVFERDFQFRDSGWTQTLEPRLYYLRVPYRDQSDLPIFDTQEIPFSFAELFRPNRFVGADRQMDANNLSLALTTRVLESSSGEERLSASIGQIRYFDEQRVQLPRRQQTDYSGSAYAGELALRLSDRWRFVLDQQWNPNTHRTDLSTFTVQNRFGNGGVVNFSYRYRRGLLDQVDLSAAVPLGDGWRLIARNNHALSMPRASAADPHGTGSRPLERFIGIEHDTCCVAWRLLARRWVHNALGESDNALYFELELKGVGSLGQQTDAFLRRAILGYQ